MNISLEEREVNVLIGILNKIDPCGIFIHGLVEKLIKTLQSQSKNDPILVQKK